MERAAEAITATKDRDAIVRMTKYFIALRDARETYRSSDRLNVDEEFLSVTAEPDDTAADLAAKLDLLNNRLGRVNALIKTIDGQIGALKQDLDLSNQMRNLVNEYNLFEDGVVFTPGPRSVDSDRENDAGGPSAGEGGAEPLPTEDIDRAGVHISPIEGLGADRGAESMTFSIEEEIERLKNLRTYMEQVRRKLADQIDKIRRAIRAKGGVPTGSLAPAPERRMEGRT
ncbi:MAG: hypothetical protein M5R36_01780 [Deltaproteobacteria bacterium]|nr:hypothetical protein [Deltaproteobacteria bacterium]